MPLYGFQQPRSILSCLFMFICLYEMSCNALVWFSTAPVLFYLVYLGLYLCLYEMSCIALVWFSTAPILFYRVYFSFIFKNGLGKLKNRAEDSPVW